MTTKKKIKEFYYYEVKLAVKGANLHSLLTRLSAHGINPVSVEVIEDLDAMDRIPADA
jgi:hypothetical protein